jgi:hypothetical protein
LAPLAGAVGKRARYQNPGENRDYEVEYRVVEAADLVQSHDPEGFRPEARYPAEVQPRNYQTPAEQGKVVQAASNLEPLKVITEDLGPENGPPVVTEDGVVLAGNGRTMALKRAMALNPEKYAGYVEALKSQAEKFGLRPEQVEGFKQPVLVRVAQGLPRGEEAGFANRANQVGTAALDPISEAISTAEKFGTVALEGLKLGPETSLRDAMAQPATLVRFVDALRRSGALRPENQGPILGRDPDNPKGVRLTEVGKDLVENALLAKGSGARWSFWTKTGGTGRR